MNEPSTPIRRLAIIGVGLIGGSTALALRAAGAVSEVVGYGRSRANLERARTLGILDTIAENPGVAVDRADLVLVAVPVGAMREVFAEIAPHLPADAVVTDAGSTKVGVIEAARDGLGEAFSRFVPGHPVAGTEYSGAEAAFSVLFRDRRAILTPVAETTTDAVARVRRFWETCGAGVTVMDAVHHDQVLAATSHLPHVLAYALVDTLARMAEHTEIFEYAAGGFADFTRIASSSPAMWTDIVTANEDALLSVLDDFIADLTTLRMAIAADDREAISDCFERAKAARDRFAEKRR